VIIEGTGWAWTFRILGMCGMVAAVLGFLFIQEPPRNFFDAAKKNAPI
jgi:hypothetical protein